MAEQTVSHTFSKREAIRFGWEIAKKNFWFFVPMILIPFAISWLFSLVSNPLFASQNGLSKMLGFLLMIVGWVVGLELGFAKLAIYFKFVDEKKASLKDLFEYFDASLLFRYFLASFLYGFATLVGLLFFIVPGIYIATKYWFAVYIYVNKRTGVLESFVESAKLTQGIKWQLFLLGLLQTLVVIAGALALLVGLFIAIPINHLSDIYIYRKLSEKK